MVSAIIIHLSYNHLHVCDIAFPKSYNHSDTESVKYGNIATYLKCKLLTSYVIIILTEKPQTLCISE